MLRVGLILVVIHIIHGYENLALNKTTYHWRTYGPFGHGTFDSSNAVDGLKTNLSAFGGQCVISENYQSTTTWWVNLRSIHSIHHIRIYFRTDNVPWGPSNGQTTRFLGFYVFVSNTTDRHDGHLCFHDTNYTKSTIPAVIEIPCPVHGQYVIYYNERPQNSTYSDQFSKYAYSDLCEVEVYGCAQIGFYGSNCSIPCLSTCQYCHIETGACQSCKPGYQGLQCRFGNLALNKPSYQSHVFTRFGQGTFDSSNAVDGLKTNLTAFGGQCVISANGFKTATWWVNLTSIHSIHHIRIYFRTDNIPWGSSNGQSTRFLGFYIYVSNTTNRLNGHLCFHDIIYTKSTIPAVIEISCPVHGQYVIYYNERPQNSTYSDQFSKDAYNDLCEVEVYGCAQTGFYGSNCSIPCPRNCQNCHIKTRVCQSCKPGFQGHQCRFACHPSFYGPHCSLKCGNCSYGKPCHNVNGRCTNGCDVGVYGDNCNKPCSAGHYGKNCFQSCSNCYICDRFTGMCTSSCKKGWKGFHCAEECDGGTYGEGCEQSCGFCLDKEQCHHINGSCTGGCAAGYEGKLCKTVCAARFYGDACKKKCSFFCKSSHDCHHVTGNCKGGCIGGWQGPHCLKVEERKYDFQAMFYGVLAISCVSLTREKQKWI